MTRAAKAIGPGKQQHSLRRKVPWFVMLLFLLWCGGVIAPAYGAKGDASKGTASRAEKSRGRPVPGKKGALQKKGVSPKVRPSQKRKPQKRRGSPSAAAPKPGKGLSLSSLVQRALRHNPTLRRLQRQVKVLRQREKQAGPWPDLQVGVQGTNFPLPSFNPTETPMSGIQYSLSQRFPIVRRLDLKRQIAQRNTERMEALWQERRPWVVYRVKKEWYWLRYRRRALVVYRELDQLLEQAAAVARTKYTTGKAAQQDFLKAKTQQAQIQNKIIEVSAEERRGRYRLGRLLGQSLGAVALQKQVLSSPKASTQKGKGSSKGALPSPQKLEKEAMASRGIARLWRVTEKQARQLLALARVRYWPDVTVKLSLRQRFPSPLDPQGAPFLSLGIKIPLPTWGNAARGGLIQEALAQQRLARSRLREVRQQIREQIRSLREQLRQYKKQLQIYQQRLLPLARQTYQSSLSSYRVDRVDFLTLLSNLRALYREKLQEHRLHILRRVTQAQLDAVLGRLPTSGQKR